jgi:pimeloyl-ACP methyl ester carboxylesterase
MTSQLTEKRAGSTDTPVAIGALQQDLLGTTFRLLTWTGPDGVRIRARDYGSPNTAKLPLLCLPGLTRNARDFEPVASHLVPRGARLIVIDSRGRGASDWDPNPANYHVMQELDDVYGLVDALGVAHVAALGTSRGGILMMISALKRPDFIQKSILNDIGPRVELGGLLKIKEVVGRTLTALTWDRAIFALSVSQGSQFPRLDHAGWERYARRLWRDVDGRPVLDYDPALAATTASLTPATKLPENWDGFASLAQGPTLVIRGALSDILSLETLEDMIRCHPGLLVHEVPDEAHVPLLEDEPTLAQIERLLLTA